MIAYSAPSEIARAYLLRRYNDIDIFVEDPSCQNMYVRLFSRILKGKAHVSHVFPLYGKQNVLDRCAVDQAPRTRPRLYVVDGDLDLLVGVRRPKLRHLYRLGAYCSENLLLSEKAIVEIGLECTNHMSFDEMVDVLGLQALVNNSVKTLLPLFIAYAISQRFNVGAETVGYSVIRMLEDRSDPTSLSRHLVAKRIAKLTRLARSMTSLREYKRVRNRITFRALEAKGNADRYISGKTYLLPLILLQLRKRTRFNDSLDGLKIRLAARCEITADIGLKRALLRALRGG